MKALVSLLSFVFVLPACGGTLDPIVGSADSGVQDSAADLRPDSPSLPGWGLVPAPIGTIALNAIWGRDASHITIVGHAGTILELQDGAWATRA